VNKDIIRLRELAKQVLEIAEDPVQERNKKLWTAVNDKKMIQPVALSRDYGLNMMAYEDELENQIEDNELKYYEMHLLALIYQWKHLRCHTITNKWILCNPVIEETFCGLPEFNSVPSDDFWRLKSTQNAKHFDPIFKDMEDMEKLVKVKVKYDKEATKKKLDRLNEIFDGILPVYLQGHKNLQCAPYDEMIRVAGIEETLLAMMVNPEFVKGFAERYIDMLIDLQKQLEELGLLNYNNCTWVFGKGGYSITSLLPQAEPGKITGAKTKESWGMINDQIFTSVSPEMTNEFAFEMEKRYAEMFGLVYYGCCERLDHKIDGVLSLPNMHKISCSPFSKTEALFEKVGDKLVISFKPNSDVLAHSNWDKEASRKEIIDACKFARKYNCHIEILMKSIINIGKGPRRLWEWCEMATEICDNY
jgi:hypothetical protein